MSLKVEESVQKIIQALKNIENIESIQRFTNTQNLLKQYGYSNILLLARQAHMYELGLSDVRTQKEWSDLGISPSYYAKALVVYQRHKQSDGTFVTEEYNAYDINHTDAVAQGVIPKETMGKREDNDYELLFQNLMPYASAMLDLKIEESDKFPYNSAFLHSKTIGISKSSQPLEKINFLLRSIYKDTISGEKIRNFTFVESHFDNAIEKLIANSYLNRLSIEPLAENELTFEEKEALFSNLEEALSIISNNIRTFDKKLMISKFINEEFDVYDESYKFAKELEDKVSKLASTQKEKEIPKKRPVEFVRLDDDEAKQLKDKTKDEILTANPIQVLEALHLNIDKEEPHRIRFKAREERSASAYMIIKGGNWIYKDFGGGDDAKGNIITLAQDKLHCEYKEAIQFCCDNLNIPNYFQIKLDEINYENDKRKVAAGWNDSKLQEKPKKTSEELLKEREEELIKQKKANLEIEKTNSTNSRVTYASKVIPNDLKNWLRTERGIGNTEIDNFYYIKGETWKLDENDKPYDIKTKSGVGVLCATKEKAKELYSQIEERGYANFDTPLSSEQEFGADLHFKPIKFTNEKGDEIVLKTQSLGAKKNTTLINNNGSTVCPIESKMDYAAAAQQIDFKKEGYDIDIANSTSNADMVAQNIAEQKYDNVYFLNQFDVPGVKFMIDICNKAKEQGHTIKKFKFIDYITREYKQDINDLHKDGITLHSRTKEGTLEDLNPLLDKIATAEKDEEKFKELNKVRTLLTESIDKHRGYKEATLDLS